MSGTALARPIEDIRKELTDLFAIAGNQPTREQRATQCARLSELHDALNAKALNDGSLFVPPLSAKRLGRKGMPPWQKEGRRLARDVVTEIFGLTICQQHNMLAEARNPDGTFAVRKIHKAKTKTVSGVTSLLIAIEAVYTRETPDNQKLIRSFCKQVATWQ
jgi:hypothetical protein